MENLMKKDYLIENNNVLLSGEIISNFKFNNEVLGEGFYIAKLASGRKSGREDIIPVMVSEKLVEVKADWTGQFVRVSGQLRSCNRHVGGRNRLILSVFVREFTNVTEERVLGLKDENVISLDGNICKQPIYRKTPLGREIADILLAVNYLSGKSDYIPCIAWREDARIASSLEVGTRLQIDGRVQSREYQKRISETESEIRAVYEVSISKLEVVDNQV